MTTSSTSPSVSSRSSASGHDEARIDHYENFPVASVLLPKQLRWPVSVIYRFARSADDIADEGDAPAAVRLQALTEYREELDRIDQHILPRTPLFEALSRVVQEHRLPLDPFRDLLSAFEQDICFVRMTDTPMLLDYCRRSANPVGRLMLHLYGAASPDRFAQSDAICTGLQLANFCQDVAIDLDKQRIYLPLDSCEKHGVSDAQLIERRCTDEWRALMAEWVEKTRVMLQSGAPLALSMPPGTARRIGWELRFIVQGGLRILDRIEAVQYDVFRQRPVLRMSDWAIITARALAMRGAAAPITPQ
jgi:squalene synthase HpnC